MADDFLSPRPLHSPATRSRNVFTLILCFPFLLPLAAAAASTELIEELSSPEGILLEEITVPILQTIDRGYSQGTFRSHAEILSYYQRVLGKLSESYPNGTLATFQPAPLEPYSGRVQSSYPEVHRLPLLPITVMVQDDATLRLFKLTIRTAAGAIYGLRAVAAIHPRYRQRGQLMGDLAYLPTVNARAMGFSWARLVPELSSNVAPSDRFYYNGFVNWELHGKNGRNDQLERPIELTNFAHMAGNGVYVISPHPDFSLKLLDWNRRDARMTYFLWNHRPAADDNPDFVFQAELGESKVGGDGGQA